MADTQADAYYDDAELNSEELDLSFLDEDEEKEIGALHMRVGIVVPHIFMQREILPQVIFSPGILALNLTEGLLALGIQVTLYTPGLVETKSINVTADLSYFEKELASRGDTYISLLKKHPLTFITLARQVQSEIIAKAFEAANNDEIDIVHIYTNEEDTALPFAKFCKKPVVFTHHDPFNFLTKYRNVFLKYKHLNWVSMSMAQRNGMPEDTNWVANIHHGLEKDTFEPNYNPQGNYLLYMGRIIESKGVHLAIQALKSYNQANPSQQYKLKIVGKHYSGTEKDTYWQEKIMPEVDGQTIKYEGFIKDTTVKQELIGNARAVLVPSIFTEPFGMVMIESLACGTPVIGLDSGAIPEVIENGKTGFVVTKHFTETINHKGHPHKIIDDSKTVSGLVDGIHNIGLIDRANCRQQFEKRFTLDRMCQEHVEAYRKLIG